MSGEQIRLQIPPKLFGINSCIAQMIRQWLQYVSGRQLPIRVGKNLGRK